MLRYILGILIIFQSALFAIDKDSVVDKLSSQTYSIEDDLAGVYKLFDPASNLWFLYMPKLNYLLIHETGKNKVADGATSIPVTDFTSIKVQNGAIVFGDYLGDDYRAELLANSSFTFDGEMAGIYNKFDTQNDLWFLYMPKLNYLLVHETGKVTTAEGAITIDTSSFQSIEVTRDPFGNNTG